MARKNNTNSFGNHIINRKLETFRKFDLEKQCNLPVQGSLSNRTHQFLGLHMKQFNSKHILLSIHMY